ncbi:hypothetical protein, partial [Caloranaerobacter azorensis]|uniref:hypothetical protein n=1 Tax=Caloranaerobacter azorensis TaxID=116090 RepID=UPI00258AB5E6
MCLVGSKQAKFPKDILMVPHTKNGPIVRNASYTDAERYKRLKRKSEEDARRHKWNEGRHNWFESEPRTDAGRYSRVETRTNKIREKIG